MLKRKIRIPHFPARPRAFYTLMTVAILAILSLSLSTSSLSPQDALEARIRSIAAAIPGNVGASILLLESPQPISFNGARHFPMQSVYKLPIAMAVLAKTETRALHLDQQIQITKSDLVPGELYSPIRDKNPNGVSLSLREILRDSIVDSDGTACDVLLRLVGFKYVNDFLHGIGIRNIVVATTEREMSTGPLVQYRNWATPEEAVNLLRKLQQSNAGISPASRELIFSWMIETQTGLHRLRALLPQGTPIAHKTGTSGTSHGLTRATNDIGIITLPDGRHLIVAVFVSDSTAPIDAIESVIAQISRAAYDAHAK